MQEENGLVSNDLQKKEVKEEKVILTRWTAQFIVIFLDIRA